MCASGKSTLAFELAEKFNSRIIHMDDFYEPRGHIDLSTSVNGNINLERFKNEIVTRLNESELTYNVFSCAEQKNVSSTILEKCDLTIVEGSYSTNPYFKKYYNFAIFLEISKKVQENRIKTRNFQNFQDFLNKWVVLENRYFDFYDIKSKANFIIENDL